MRWSWVLGPAPGAFGKGDSEITFRFAGRAETVPEVRAVELSIAYKQSASRQSGGPFRLTRSKADIGLNRFKKPAPVLCWR